MKVDTFPSSQPPTQRVKIEEEARRAKVFEERKQKIKTEIILKALAESNDLEQLRQEKRLIQVHPKLIGKEFQFKTFWQ